MPTGTGVRCVFIDAALSGCGEDSDVYDCGALTTFLNVRGREMIELMSLIGEELATPGMAREAMAEALGIALLIQVARYVFSRAQGDVGHCGGLSR